MRSTRTQNNTFSRQRKSVSANFRRIQQNRADDELLVIQQRARVKAAILAETILRAASKCAYRSAFHYERIQD